MSFSPEVNVIAWLVFELAYFEAAIQHFSHKATRNALLGFFYVAVNKLIINKTQNIFYLAVNKLIRDNSQNIFYLAVNKLMRHNPQNIFYLTVNKLETNKTKKSFI